MPGSGIQGTIPCIRVKWIRARDWCAEFVSSIAGGMQSRWSWTKARAALAGNPANRTAVIPASAIEAWITLEVFAVKRITRKPGRVPGILRITGGSAGQFCLILKTAAVVALGVMMVASRSVNGWLAR
jgi:hypothetical protein